VHSLGRILQLKNDQIEFEICPQCGSVDIIEDYPSLGKLLCTQCGNEGEKIKLENGFFDSCRFCGKERKEHDTFFEDDNVLIYKCEKCGKLSGCVVFSDFVYGFDGVPDSFSVKIAKTEGSYIHPESKCREWEKELRKKENDLGEKCKKQLDYLIYAKQNKLFDLGISREIIDVAMSKAKIFIDRHGTQTNKKINCLLPAALLSVTEKKLTERQLEKIFGVTRKTIRKWKEILQKEPKKERPPLKLGLRAYIAEGKSRRIVVEIPTEIKSIARLEKPFEAKCHFCENIELLSWRVRYVNGSWSDICEKSYELLNDFATEYGWKIEQYLL
jgi:transposase